jgi:hypothetical protein
MLRWLETNSKALQALAGIVTALLALLALVGVKWQIDASFDAQREQSARDIYREFLNLSIGNPDFAEPDYCAIKASPKAAAYAAYVDYMLYAAEQSLDMDAEMKPVFEEHLERHADYICATADWSGYSAGVASMVAAFRKGRCAAENRC